MNIQFDSLNTNKVYMVYEDATVIFYYNSLTVESNNMPFDGTVYTVTFTVNSIAEIIKKDVNSSTDELSGVGIFTIFQYDGKFHRFDDFYVSKFDTDNYTGLINEIEIESRKYKMILSKNQFFDMHKDNSKITDFML